MGRWSLANESATPNYAPTDVEVHFHFEVPDLWIDGDLRGFSENATREGFTMRLTFPRDPSDFAIREHDGWTRFVVSGRIEDGQAGRSAEAVDLVRISVDCTLPFGPDDIGQGRRPFESVFREGVGVLQGAADVSRELLHDYLELIRTEHGQSWLGLTTSRPRVASLTKVFEKETGRQVMIGYNDRIAVMTIQSVDEALSLAEHRSALARASVAEPPSLQRSLIADAEYLGLWSEPLQPREAVLLAAIACEVTIKQTLRVVCSADARPVLDWALDNPRDVSQQAAGLFDKTAKAVVGRSLREEHKAVYKGIEALFTDRNAVAHRGAEIGEVAMHKHLAHAKFALGWASGLAAATAA
jgi:hypothetical protein